MDYSQSLPSGFVSNMIELLGREDVARLITALEGEAPTSIRFNRRKPIPIDMERLGARQVPWCPRGYYLSERPVFTGDPLFHSGYYYVQEASSMLLHEVCKLLPSRSLVALDLCAAPGGKSSLLIDMLPEDSVLISNEVVGHRANILVENLWKWGNPSSIVTSAYPERLGQLRGVFDLILVDAPCSGEGMFRKDLNARAEWGEHSPRECAIRQREILTDIWDSLSSGGYLVYSTCTFNREENEEIVAFIVEELGAEVIDLEIEIDGVLRSPLSSYPCYRMMPYLIEGEGLFMAALRKTDRGELRKKDKGDSKKSRSKRFTAPKEVTDWLAQGDEPWQWSSEEELIYAYPAEIEPLLALLSKRNIRPLSYGIPVAVAKGKGYSPHPALAYSPYLSSDAFERVEVSHSEAIAFLAKETITLSSNISAGIKLLEYRTIPLGFVKHLGNRSNNLLPTEWRIRQPERVRSLLDSTSSLGNNGIWISQYLISD